MVYEDDNDAADAAAAAAHDDDDNLWLGVKGGSPRTFTLLLSVLIQYKAILYIFFIVILHEHHDVIYRYLLDKSQVLNIA
jgi:hypothetical protein